MNFSLSLEQVQITIRVIKINSTFVKFNLSGLPSNATVLNAQMLYTAKKCNQHS